MSVNEVPVNTALRFCWQAPMDWARIESQWLSLSAQTPSNIFLSWPWIATWVETYDAVAQVLRVYDGQTLVAMGLWAYKYHKRPLGLHVRTLHLHHCGDEALDQIWPEYNELLCLPSYRTAVHSALLDNMPRTLQVTEVDLGVCDDALSELVLSHPTSMTMWARCKRLLSHFAPGAPSAGWLCEQRWSSNSIQVRLSDYPDVQAYLGSLSSSFRYQLRRAEKGLSALGPVQLLFAEDADQCAEWLLADARWHRQQWGADSGFNNPEFVRFHQAWITRAFGASHCGYARLMAGDTPAAGAYFFQDKTTIYFYLGFARNEWGPKVKTGFCLHLAMIRYCYERGIAVYDFMGGDYEYKRRFGVVGLTLVKCRFKPNTLVNGAEQALKHVRARIKSAKSS